MAGGVGRVIERLTPSAPRRRPTRIRHAAAAARHVAAAAAARHRRAAVDRRRRRPWKRSGSRPKVFTLGGLAYDAVSHRFLFGDRLGRKLIVVGEGSNHAVDFVRADSAGFHDIAAIEIDAKRGDLWVASAAPADGAGTLHKLQLVSGRPLKSFPVAADLEPVTLVDLAVTPAGAVLVLDSAGRSCSRCVPAATSLERVMRIDASGAGESCRRR